MNSILKRRKRNVKCHIRELSEIQLLQCQCNSILIIVCCDKKGLLGLRDLLQSSQIGYKDSMSGQNPVIQYIESQKPRPLL